MWLLPTGPWNVSLPEGFLLVPHHYDAGDREALLALLRAALPESRQLLLEAASLDALIDRGLTWREGIVLLHGFGAAEAIDDARTRVSVLGARHVLAQLPRAQLTGTSWMEPTLKVPLLRALERAWRDPEHPLSAVKIAEMPLREAARYTDDPAELLAIVRTAVEHRLANASAGVGARDWSRSLDHALAQRLRRRVGEELSSEVIAWTSPNYTAPDSSEEETSHLQRRGLIVAATGGLRPSPLIAALRRPLVRAHAAPSATHDEGELSARAHELFHMAAEGAAVVAPIGFRVFWTARDLTRSLIREHPWAIPNRGSIRHRLLRLTPVRHQQEVAASILALRNSPASVSAAARKTAIAYAVYLAGLYAFGREARRSLAESIDELSRLKVAFKWRDKAVDVLRAILLKLSWLERAAAGDVDSSVTSIGAEGTMLSSVGAVVAALKQRSSRSANSRGDEPFLCAVADGSHEGTELDQNFSRYDREITEDTGPEKCWWTLARGRAPLVVRASTDLGTGSLGIDSMTLGDLHNDLVVGIAALAIGDLDLAATRGRLVLDLATRYEIPVHRAFARELLAAVHELRGEHDEAAKLLFQSRSRYAALEDFARVEGVEKRLSRMGITFDPITPKPRVAPRKRRS